MIAVFLAWRTRDHERAGVSAVTGAGGRVHFIYQDPVISSSDIIDIWAPQEFECLCQYNLKCLGGIEPPQTTISEIAFGSGHGKMEGNAA